MEVASDTSTTLQFIAILVTVASLLGWLLKAVIQHFIAQSSSLTAYVEKLVQQNQENTTNFVNTINHQRTLDREMQTHHTVAISKLSTELETSNKISTEMLSFLKETR